jgi:starch synthase
MGMQGLLQQRRQQLTGILNGIDTADWNPSSDLHLAHSFSYRAMAGKRRCKAALQAELGLASVAEAPLFGVVSRLTHQKGLDWILEIAQGILAQGGQIAILGTGETPLEAGFKQLAQNHPQQVAAYIGYDEGLSHRIEAGADLFLMPSRFEPCGLNQMYSQRYGTLPIVRETGGLADSVTDGVDGFSFMGDTAHALWLTVERALAAYHDRPLWRRLQQTAMRKDASWEKSAREYAALYTQLAAQAHT